MEFAIKTPVKRRLTGVFIRGASLGSALGQAKTAPASRRRAYQRRASSRLAPRGMCWMNSSPRRLSGTMLPSMTTARG